MTKGLRIRLSRALPVLTLAATSLSLVACQSDGPATEYSAGYSYAAMGPGAMLMPDACSVPDMRSDRLPPGCANAYNLQRMVERERDLVQGRRMGPAPAAPATRAANVYLYGETTTPGAPEGRPPAPDPQPSRP